MVKVSARAVEPNVLLRRVPKFVLHAPSDQIWNQLPLPWGTPNRPRRRRTYRNVNPTRLAIRQALGALLRAEKADADQGTLRERYFALEAAMAADECHHEQLELQLYDGVRLERRDRLAKLGKDPEPDRVFEDSAPHIQRFADVFPEGMTFTEIGWVLGCRKQQAFKFYLRGTAKMLRALGADAEKIRDHLRTEAERASNWESMMGT